MNFILTDGPNRVNLLPLTFTRPVGEIRCGILTLREKWEYFLNQEVSYLTEDYLSRKYPLKSADENIIINASFLPDENIVQSILNLKPGEVLYCNDEFLAYSSNEIPNKNALYSIKPTSAISFEVDMIKNNWDIFSLNSKYIKRDFDNLTHGRQSQKLSESNFVQGDVDNIFIEEGAKVEFAFLNANEGPIYIGKNAEIMEGSKIRGPFAICENSTIKMDAKIYGGTTIGPHCKVGGEVSNAVFFGYSNKAHDGFLGNAVIGEWCNLGADTNNSNLKNTYDEVKLWSYSHKSFVKTGLQFCGLIMGDHSKTGINTMFNTGTVAGVSCNIYGSGFQRNFIPSFSWGSPAAMKTYILRKAFQSATAVYKRRSKEFNDIEKEIFEHIFKLEQAEV